MNELEEPAVMLDTWDKWGFASRKEQFYYKAWLSQEQEKGGVIESSVHEKCWIICDDSTDLLNDKSLYRLKPKNKKGYTFLNSEDLEGCLVQLSKEEWYLVDGFNHQTNEVKFNNKWYKTSLLAEEGWRYRKIGEDGNGQLCRKEKRF